MKFLFSSVAWFGRFDAECSQTPTRCVVTEIVLDGVQTLGCEEQAFDYLARSTWASLIPEIQEPEIVPVPVEPSFESVRAKFC